MDLGLIFEFSRKAIERRVELLRHVNSDVRREGVGVRVGENPRRRMPVLRVRRCSADVPEMEHPPSRFGLGDQFEEVSVDARRL